MNEREEQIEWIAGALAGLGVGAHTRDDWAPRLYAQGVRVLGPGEAVIDVERTGLAITKLLNQAAQRAPKLKPGVVGAAREEQILAAMHNYGEPIETYAAIRAAAGWHRDYQPPAAEWDPWRDAWSRLIAQRRVQKGSTHLGGFPLWEPVPVPIGGWHPAVVEFWERQREFPGLCVALVPGGRSTMYGDICGKPEAESATGACKEHPQ